MATDPKDIIYWEGSGDWSALYVKGRLETAGSMYHIQEVLFTLLDITVEYGDDFMLGGNTYGDVAEFSEDAYKWQNQVTEREERAAKLREQAKALIAEASRLEG